MSTPKYKPCVLCEGMGFLMEIEPIFAGGEEDEKGGMRIQFSVGIDRAKKVPCSRCEGLGKVPDMQGKRQD